MGEKSYSGGLVLMFIFTILVISLNTACQSDFETRPSEGIEEPTPIDQSTYIALGPIDQKLQDAEIACDNKNYVEARELLNSLKDVELSSNQHFYFNNILNRIKLGEEMAEYDREMHPTVKAAEREYDAGRYRSAKSLLKSVDLRELSDSDKHRRDNLLEMIRNYVK